MTISNYLLLDTNFVSYIMKGTPEAERDKPYLQGKTLAFSFITVGELWAGATYQGWGVEKRKQLASTLRNFVVIPYDFEITKCYGEIVAQRKKAGRPISVADAWIAACAVRHQIPLVSHNFRDFEAMPNLVLISVAA